MRQNLLLLVFALPLAAQASQPAKPAAPQWQKAERKTTERVDQLCENLKRPKEELRQAAEQELMTMPEAAVPLLIQKLSDFPSNINEPLFRVLEKLTVKEHAPLLAGYAKEKRQAIRFFVVGRLAGFADKTMEPVFTHALKDKDPEVAYRAALGLVALGDKKALPLVVARCAAAWDEIGEITMRTIAPGKSSDHTRALLDVFDQAAPDDAKTRIIALRLLRALGVKEEIMAIKIHLDSDDHATKKETINALRVIVAGQPPLEDLSVFDAIEMAKEWKARNG